MDVRVGLWRKLSAKELMLLNCGVGEDSWESLGLQIQPVHSKGDQSWVFIGRTDAEAETLILWPPDVKSWLTEKDSDAGEGWRQKEKGGQRMRWLGSITDSMDMNLSKFWEILEDRGLWQAAVRGITVRHDLVTPQQWQQKCRVKDQSRVQNEAGGRKY